MKKIRYIIPVFIFFQLSLSAQESDKAQYALTTSHTTVGLGSTKILDPYLSPFEYKGWQAKFQNISRKYFNPANENLSYNHKGFLGGGIATHPQGSNIMYFFDVNYAFGINYHFRPFDRLTILAGGSWDVNFGGKYLARNVNNPFSLDLCTNLNATAEAQYAFNLWKQEFRLQYGVQTPLAGYMMVPQQGSTYYEMFVLKNLNDVFHLSSLHNKRAFYQYFNIDIPTKIATFRVGVSHDFLRYSANEMVFRDNGLVFHLGSVVDIYTFRGKKKKIPENFIRTYE
ncbi:MAG: DUF3316 domain-containing protein [Paludibacteraceae bacterium]